MSRRAPLAVVAATLCLLAIEAPGAGFVLNGRALGDRVDDVVADARYECGGASACFLFTACTFKPVNAEKLHGAHLTALTLYYMGERIAAMEARFDSVQFDQVVQATVQRHGAAQRVPGTPTDAATGNVVYIWREGARLLRLERSFGGGEASLIIAEQSVLGELLDGR